MSDIVIKIAEVIDSQSANTDTKGDAVFNEIKSLADEKNKGTIELDFSDIELVNTAFLNNAIGRLFNKQEFDISKQRIRIKDMHPSMYDLFKESISVAQQKYNS